MKTTCILLFAASAFLTSCAARRGGSLALECSSTDYCPPSSAHPSKTEIAIVTRDFTFPWSAKRAPWMAGSSLNPAI